LIDAKNMLVLIFIFMFLGGYLIIYEPNKKQDKMRLFTFDTDKVEEIKLKKGGILYYFHKKDSAWVTQSPYHGSAPPEVIKGFLNLLTYGIIRIIDINADDLTRYGLEKPLVEFSIRLNGEYDFKTLLIGDSNPARTTCYAKIMGEPSVFLLGNIFRWELERDIPTGKSE